jgi:predicted short-subunit dehydrogenase-like oxidoreductase (DUF2520 family)
MPESLRLTGKTPVGFIGAGRLGSSLAVAMSRAGYNVTAASSRRSEHRDWLQKQLPGAFITDTPQAVGDACTAVFITTSDAAIESVARSVRWHPGQAVIHCSGAAPLAALASAASAGALTGGIHPVQTFPSREAADSFNGITFGIEAASPQLESWLHDLARGLGGTPVRIKGDQRAAYHAAAVMACGLLAGLTGLAAEAWASTGGISRDDAVRSLSPLVISTASWIGEKGIPGAITGPYVRGDVETVRRHLEAVSAVSPEHGAAYAALALASLHIAREQGGLSDEAYHNIKRMLVSSLVENCGIIESS